MKESKITIITPTYNRAHTLDRAYQSLKRQTFKDFKWLITDDGSTDHTEELVNTFITENQLDVEYRKSENSKKFYTVFKAIESVKTDYFTVLDSDDAYPYDGLEILINEADKLDKTQFISVIGHSVDDNGKIFGNLFPDDGFDGSVLEMRYRQKIKGDKNGLFITQPYQKYLKEFDFEFYKGKYAPQKIFFQIYDGDGMKTRFINQIVRIYYQDLSDLNSMSADRVKSTSYLGLRDGHLSFINSYSNQFWNYPEAMIRNIMGYEIYSILMGDDFKKMISKINSKSLQILSILLYPVGFIYTQLKGFK